MAKLKSGTTIAGSTAWHAGNDGASSGLDADLLDGNHASAFVAKGTGYTWTAVGGNALSFRSNDTLETNSGDQASLEVLQDTSGADAFMQFHVAGDYAAYFGLKGDINDFAVGGWSMGSNYYRVWHEGNDGSGSGLDADTLDGYHESTFMRRTANSHLLMNNKNISQVNALYFSDPGPDEGIHWTSSNNWKIYESPDDLTTNSTGNLQFVTGSTRRATLDISGNLWIGGAASATSFEATSDINLKENIAPIEDAITKVSKLSGYTYSFKDNPDEPRAGLIAQEVQEVLPEAVKADGEGVLRLDYNATIALLVEALKEQQKQIEELKSSGEK